MWVQYTMRYLEVLFGVMLAIGLAVGGPPIGKGLQYLSENATMPMDVPSLPSTRSTTPQFPTYSHGNRYRSAPRSTNPDRVDHFHSNTTTIPEKQLVQLNLAEEGLNQVRLLERTIDILRQTFETQ